MLTADDLLPGAVFNAPHQGMCITPQNRKVTIHWVGPDAVHYFIENMSQLRETSIDRFLSIINRKQKGK